MNIEQIAGMIFIDRDDIEIGRMTAIDPEAFLRRLAEGYDREEAAQMGEASPCAVDVSDDDEEWKLDRIGCARAGLHNALRGAMGEGESK